MNQGERDMSRVMMVNSSGIMAMAFAAMNLRMRDMSVIERAKPAPAPAPVVLTRQQRRHAERRAAKR